MHCRSSAVISRFFCCSLGSSTLVCLLVRLGFVFLCLPACLVFFPSLRRLITSLFWGDDYFLFLRLLLFTPACFYDVCACCLFALPVGIFSSLLFISALLEIWFAFLHCCLLLRCVCLGCFLHFIFIISSCYFLVPVAFACPRWIICSPSLQLFFLLFTSYIQLCMSAWPPLFLIACLSA